VEAPAFMAGVSDPLFCIAL